MTGTCRRRSSSPATRSASRTFLTTVVMLRVSIDAGCGSGHRNCERRGADSPPVSPRLFAPPSFSYYSSPAAATSAETTTIRSSTRWSSWTAPCRACGRRISTTIARPTPPGARPSRKWRGRGSSAREGLGVEEGTAGVGGGVRAMGTGPGERGWRAGGCF